MSQVWLRNTINGKTIAVLYGPVRRSYMHHRNGLRTWSAYGDFKPERRKLTNAPDIVQSSNPQLFVLSLAQTRTRYIRAVHTKNSAIAELSHDPRLAAICGGVSTLISSDVQMIRHSRRAAEAGGLIHLRCRPPSQAQQILSQPAPGDPLVPCCYTQGFISKGSH